VDGRCSGPGYRSGVLGCALLDPLGHRHVPIEGGHIVELEMDDSLRGPSGALHGGLLAALVDCAGASCLAVASGHRPVATSHVSIDYLSAARVGPITARAELLRRSDNQGVAEVRVTDTGREDRLVAVALLTATFFDAPAADANGPGAG
jgi:uncharacterized protein (TIGR00369 family)